MKNFTKALLIAVSLYIATPAVYAGPLFNVNRTIGGGSVVGTIETDGTIGLLNAANILGWTLDIDDGDGSGVFTMIGGTNSGLLLSGTLLSATLTDLVFNFGGSNGFALFQSPSPGSGQNWWCVEGLNSNCAGSGNSTESVNRFGNPTFAVRQGSMSIGTTVTSVPEPGTLAILSLGLLGLGALRRKQAK